ncbi:unnamed protein product, partial [Polarella glacialis]
AMTGKLGSIQLLLKYEAEPMAESAFAEDALFVAQQNPAAFLGQHTRKAIALLQAWEVAAEDAKTNLVYHSGASSEEELVANNNEIILCDECLASRESHCSALRRQVLTAMSCFALSRRQVKTTKMSA